MMVTPEAIIAEARLWLGTPFLHQGRTTGGVDCVGLPIVVGQALGLLPADFDSNNYGRLPTGEIVDRVRRYGVALPAPKPGCVIVIAWTRVAAHMAICTGDTLIHSYERNGGVIEHGYRGRWLRMTHSAWGFPGVTYV